MFLDDESQPETRTVVFVGGPPEDERATVEELPPEGEMADGSYVRSVRCADDSGLRYVWSPRED